MAILRNIGNSMGVLIPKSLIEQAGLDNCELEFQLEVEGLLIKPVKKKCRTGWQKKITLALENNVDEVDSEWLDAELDSCSDD